MMLKVKREWKEDEGEKEKMDWQNCSLACEQVGTRDPLESGAMIGRIQFLNTANFELELVLAPRWLHC